MSISLSQLPIRRDSVTFLCPNLKLIYVDHDPTGNIIRISALTIDTYPDPQGPREIHRELKILGEM